MRLLLAVIRCTEFIFSTTDFDILPENISMNNPDFSGLRGT